MTRLATWLVILLTFATVYGTLSLWQTGRHPWETPPPPKTSKEIVQEQKQVADEEQVEYLAAIIRHSFRGEPREMLLTGLAAKNTGVLLNLNYQQVFRKAAEYVPPWSKKSVYVRWRDVVMGLGTKGERAAARSLARQIVTNSFEEPYASILEALPPEQKCVTTLYRPEGNKQIPTDDDLELMRAWTPKAHVASDGAFWLCLPKEKPKS